MASCPECRAELSPGAAFCRECGTPVGGPAVGGYPPPPPGTAPPAPGGGGAAPVAAGTRSAGWTIGAALAGIFFVLALACNLLVIVLTVPSLAGLALSSVAAIVPAILYSLLVIALDRYEREPWRVLLGSFAWGAVVATLFSLIFGGIGNVLLTAAVGESLGGLLGAAFVAPLVEETFKGVAVLGLLLLFRDEFDNILDGLVYGALIGLGFAMTENILYLGRAYIEEGVPGLSQLFIAREVFGGFGHALYTGTTGAAIGWAREHRGRGALRVVVPLIGWALAVFQHFLWNAGSFVLAAFQGAAGLVLPTVIVAAALFLLPGLIALAAIAVAASRRESRIIGEHLADEVRAGLLTPGEYAMLSHTRSRQEAALAAFRRGGVRGWLAQERFFQAAAELAFRKHHRSRGENPTTEGLYRARIAAIRAELQAGEAQA